MKALAVLLLLGIVIQEKPALQVDGPRSTVTFTIRNFGLDVEGTIGAIKGSIVYDSARVGSSAFRLSADVATIDTGIALRNQHLQKAEYFDAKSFPVIRFESTEVREAKAGELLVAGRLTIKNTTRQINVPVKIIRDQQGISFRGSFNLDRRDYDVGGNSFSLADQVAVTFDLRAVDR